MFIFEEVFKALNKAKVKYVVIGGIAVVLHGYRRFTEDLDLMVYMEEKNLDRLYETLLKTGYQARLPVTKDQFIDKKQREEWKKKKHMVVFSFFERKTPFKIVDVMVDEPVKFDQVYRECSKVKLEGVTIPVISIRHLKILKRKAGRDIDDIDIKNLEAIEKLNKAKS